MKHVIITGSTRGIGLGLATRFLERGCRVTINGTTVESVNKALSSLLKHYPSSQIQGFAGNVGVLQEVENLWSNAVKNFGDVHIWINNAGIDQERKKVWDLQSEKVEELIKTNILGVILGSQVAFRGMFAQGFGQIYNMEGFGSDGMMREKMTLYGMTKSAVRYFTRSLAQEAENTPVLVGTLSPGMVLTDFLLKSISPENEDAAKNRKVFNILADRVETVTEFLCQQALSNTKNNSQIRWLTKRKVIWRFLSSKFKLRDLFKQ